MLKYEAEIKEITAMMEKNKAAGKKWINPNGKSPFRIPEYEEDPSEFIADWIDTCPEGTKKELKEIEKNVRKIAKQKGYQLKEWHVALVQARRLAVIKRDLLEKQQETLKKFLDEYKVDKSQRRGHTYIAEIIQIMNVFINETSKLCPNVLAKYENNPPRKKV